MTKKNQWKKQFLMISLGQAVSLLGSSGVQFALIWWLAERTSSPLMLGMAGLAAYLPMTFLSPIAGVVADKYNRKIISIVSDMSMGIAAMLYAILLFFFELPVWTVMVMLCIRGIGSTFQQPAIQSIIPQLVPSDRLVRTNGWMQLLNSGSFILGPVIGGVMYAAVPMWVILLSDVIGASAASLALGAVPIPRLLNDKMNENGVFTQFKEGLCVFKEDKRLLYLIVCEAMCMFFFAPLSSFYPLMTSDYFGLSAVYGSIVETAFAVGMMLSALLFSSVLKVRKKIGASYIGLIGMGITTMLCGLIPATYGGWFVFMVTCGLLGAFGNVHTIPLTAYMQETIAAEKMGRAFSVLTLISAIAMPVGLLFGSPIADKVGVHTWFFISGIGMLVITAAVTGYSKVKRMLLPLLAVALLTLSGCAENLSELPPFSGNPYTELNGNVPEFSEGDYVTTSFEEYSELDALGRCGTAFANIGTELMPTEERSEIGLIKPSGWHTVKYDFIDGKYLYNRCHLIGYQLAGENANEKNLITGTRYMNVQGMLPFENRVADYVEATNHHVLYRVTPIYDGDNLVADGVQMEAWSVEDEGEGICFNVYVYNREPGIKIDYATGESSKEAAVESTAGEEYASEEEYILNTNTDRFHLSSCLSAADIKAENKEVYKGTRKDLIQQGYKPCGRCHP